MKIALNLSVLLLFSITCLAQKPVADTWSNVPKSQDDRYTNPKSAVYAGPNGWWNFGEVRAEGVSTPTLKYAYKGGLSTNSDIFSLNESGKLQILNLDFGTEEPAPGTYQVGKKADQAGKKVIVSFSDVANKAIKNWTAEDGAGTVTVTKSGEFIYFKARNIVLQPSGVYNKNEYKQALKLGFEGASKP
ncbi:hypothetical protein [Dyadobacter sp. CY312]|uniref:hypothetical protein n=1 Tax=Dyadobacter sp. CY312 TaxID=2907303 RepID=UPI001F33A665|nr:hypothetical protein [Dyadobacter sp. CY312]MCE7041847.1 hypothetical protein [Dyadobacter sp. CY312]